MWLRTAHCFFFYNLSDLLPSVAVRFGFYITKLYLPTFVKNALKLMYIKTNLIQNKKEENQTDEVTNAG